MPAASFAQGEHGRRAASEIRVLLGDLRRLALPETSPLHRQGLAERIRGGLAPLALLLREADAERGRGAGGERGSVDRLRQQFDAGAHGEVVRSLQELADAYPLVAPELIAATTTPARLARGRDLHARLCAACHDTPDHSVARPAYDLFAEATSATAQEFAARLIVGVRGDVSTGLGNPLSDEEMASLIAAYRAGLPAQQ